MKGSLVFLEKYNLSDAFILGSVCFSSKRNPKNILHHGACLGTAGKFNQTENDFR